MMSTKVIFLHVLVLFCLVAPVFGESWWWPPTDGASVNPPSPTSADLVTITIKGDWPDSCVPTGSSISIQGNNIFFDAIANPSSFCLTVITPWEQAQTVGPLAPGLYIVWARLIDSPDIPPIYSLITTFRVVPAIQTSIYQFLEDHSKLFVTGGIAGINEIHNVEGDFQLTINKRTGTASFDWVDAGYSGGEIIGSGNLGDLFNMTNLMGTILSDTEIEFAGFTAEPPVSEITLRLDLYEGLIQLVGEFPPEGTCCDFFFYELDAIALETSGTCEYLLLGDVNEDCRVDLQDLALMCERWLTDCHELPLSTFCLPK